ncbi:MAG: hypothetical protein N3D11_17075 [Candidatus Sumerlaeia bacterium]|nr:hypothetical protein [Candidatus Sumerlaeia bacterium]
MSVLQITLHDNRTEFLPGETVEGRVSWQLAQPAKSVEVRLFWFTRGKGTTDVEVAATARFDRPAPSDQQPFRFTLPKAPYSFSGKLISLVWAIELVVEPSGETERVEIVLSPTGREILLYPDLASPA